MTFNPLVSVIINNYNYNRYLSEAIESVLIQTYKNYELIIVDDGSTDDSKNTIDRYKREYPNIIMPIYKENGGQASAFNKGFLASRGEIIAFLDSDDYWFPKKIEEIVKAHEDNKIVQHNLLINGKQKYYEKLDNRPGTSIFFRKYGLYGLLIPTSGLSYKRDLLENVFPIPEEVLRLCADTFVLFNALYFSDIYTINEDLGYYRVHGQNAFYNNFDKEENKEKNDIIKTELNNKLIGLGLPKIPFDSYSNNELINAYIIDIIKGDSYLLYGTGRASKDITNLIEKEGAQVKYYCDSDSDKWGNFFLNKEIISPREITNKRAEISKIIIASMYVNEILDGLKKLGFEQEKDILIPLM